MTSTGEPAPTEGPERSDDGRYLIVQGRRWRTSDPAIPDKLRAELVSELMDARRLVRVDPERARPRVQDAKVALGERGDPWWEPTDEGTRARLAAAMRALLRHRPGSTICPSDAARISGGQDWRSLMDTARQVAHELSQAGQIRLQQHGQDVDDLDTVTGPIRLASGSRLDSHQD